MHIENRSCATYDDVNLVLRLYDIRREARMREARKWFVGHFKAQNLDEAMELIPPGSSENENFRMVTSYWDMAASFIVGGVLQREIFFESNREMLLVWERIRDMVPAYREMVKDPLAYHNLETVAEDFVDWMKKRGPEAYEAFVSRVRGS